MYSNQKYPMNLYVFYRCDNKVVRVVFKCKKI